MMGALDTVLCNFSEDDRTFLALSSRREKKLLVHNKEGRLVCTLYDNDLSRQCISTYLEENSIEKNDVYFTIEGYDLSSEKQHLINKYKLVLLDEHLVVFKDIIKKSDKYLIKGYNHRQPKAGFNKYITIGLRNSENSYSPLGMR